MDASCGRKGRAFLKNAVEAHQQEAPTHKHGAEVDDETVDDGAHPVVDSF